MASELKKVNKIQQKQTAERLSTNQFLHITNLLDIQMVQINIRNLFKRPFLLYQAMFAVSPFWLRFRDVRTSQVPLYKEREQSTKLETIFKKP